MGDLPASLAAARQRALNGGQRPRPRPLPRTPQQPYRSAFWDAPETNLPYRAPEQALADRNTLPYQRQETLPQRQVRNDMAQLADRSAAGGSTGYAERNQVREFGNSLMEATGAPSWARGIEALQYNQPGEAIPEFLMGAVNTASIASLPYGAGPSAPIRGFQRPPMLPEPAFDMAGLGRSVSRGLSEEDGNLFAMMGRDGPPPTPEEALGRPLTPDHIWNDPRFQHRLSITSDLEGVKTPEERFHIAEQRIAAEQARAREPARPTARIERDGGTVMLHNPDGSGGEFHRTIHSARQSAERQGWDVILPDQPEMPPFMRGEVADRLARQRRLTESNEAAAQRMADEQGLEHPPAMAGIPDYLSGWPGRGLNRSGVMDEAGRLDQGAFTAALLEGELGPYRIGGPYQEVPLMGTPDIAADPMAFPRRPGFGPRPQLPLRQGPNEDRYLFGRPPIRQSMVGGSNDLAEAAGMRPQQAPDGGASGAGQRALEPYLPRDDAGNPIASDAFPFGFRRLEPGYRSDQFMASGSTKFEWPDEGVSVQGMRRSRETVPITSLNPTQIRVWDNFLNPDRPRNAPTMDGRRSPFADRPGVVRVGDELFVIDGHNRIAEAAARGETSVDVTVLDGSRLLRGRRAPDAPNASNAPPRTTEAPDAGSGGERIPARAAPTGPPRTPPRPRPPRRQPENSYREQLRSDGFDVDTPLYHGTQNQIGSFDRPMWATPSADAANDYAMEGAFGRNAQRVSPNVLPIYGRARNPLHIREMGDLEAAMGEDARLLNDGDGDMLWEALDDPVVQRVLRNRGYDSVHIYEDYSPSSVGGNGRHSSILFLDPQNIAPRFGPPNTPPPRRQQ